MTDNVMFDTNLLTKDLFYIFYEPETDNLGHRRSRSDEDDIVLNTLVTLKKTCVPRMFPINSPFFSRENCPMVSNHVAGVSSSRDF